MTCGSSCARATLLGPVTSAAEVAPAAAACRICRRVNAFFRSTSSESPPGTGAISILLCLHDPHRGSFALIFGRLTEFDAAELRQVGQFRGQDHRDDDERNGEGTGGGGGRFELEA